MSLTFTLHLQANLHCEFMLVPGITGFTLILPLLTRVSALLAESDPSNSTYLLATNESLNFTLPASQGTGAILSPVGSGPILEQLLPGFDLIFPQGTSYDGFIIEAMAIMISMDQREDIVSVLKQTVTGILDRLFEKGWFPAGSGTLPNAYYPFINDTANGNVHDQEDGDMYFLRGLAAVWRLGEKLPPDFRDVIKIIMGVHYNAIRDNAKIGDLDLYGRSWQPGVSNSNESFDMYNQVAAAQILVDGIDLFNEGNSSSPNTSTPPPPSKSRTGMIVGATIGSVAFVSILAIAAFVFLHRHRWHRAAPSSEFTSRWISPFYGEKSGEPPHRATHWHTKNQSNFPLLLDSRGTGIVSEPLILPASFQVGQETPLSEMDEHQRGDVGHPEAVPGMSREDGREGTAMQMGMAPGFPDLVHV
ncbi:hypothetical protein V5O48_012195, partial [Marasmius crinis-equi]